LEVRRAEGGIRVWATDPGESYHAFGGGYGGLVAAHLAALRTNWSE